MKTSEFDYTLPSRLIAQTPTEPRDQSRFMVLSRADRSIEHRRFFEIIDYLKVGDVLVLNESRVIPARLLGHKVDTGGKVEILLLRRLGHNLWQTLVKPGRRVNVGARIEFRTQDNRSLSGDATVLGMVLERGEGGIRVIQFSDEAALTALRKVPLPPYIRVPLANSERYQTVYARINGSVAAPTAGLHFTPELIERIRDKGVTITFVTLHVGLDSFRPVQVDDPRDHPLHKEWGELSPDVARELNKARTEGRRIICVGTTTVRLVEEAARGNASPSVPPFTGETSLFILPSHRFRMVDALVTNFHLPRSTLLMLVSAFAGRDFIRHAYEEAIRLGYRFYSFGDAMLIL